MITVGNDATQNGVKQNGIRSAVHLCGSRHSGYQGAFPCVQSGRLRRHPDRRGRYQCQDRQAAQAHVQGRGQGFPRIAQELSGDEGFPQGFEDSRGSVGTH